MYDNWKDWCRLCGSSEEHTIIDISIKDEQFNKMTTIIQNLLSITITNSNKITPKICTICRDILLNFMNFSARAAKIQEMFTEMYEINYENIDVNKIRCKYGLNNITSISVVQHEENDNDLFTKIEIDNNVDTVKITQPLFVNVDVLCPDNIKKETIADKHIDEEQKFNLTKKKTIITCEICSKKFYRQSNLTTHMKCAHSIENKKKSLPCDICGKTFPTQQKLIAHSRTHIPLEERSLHQCPECDKKLSCEASLKQHIRSKHTADKPFVCEQCGKTFSTKQEMKVHKFVHDTDNEFRCKKCIKIFKNEFRLKVHMKVHRDRIYPCSICGLQLKTPKTLKNHLIIHTDEMPFNCNYCGATFRRDKNLRAHMIIHTGLKPYECPFCTQSYANRSNCKKHQKHSHPEEFAALQASGIQQYSKNVPKLKQLQAMLEQMKTDIQQ